MFANRKLKHYSFYTFLSRQNNLSIRPEEPPLNDKVLRRRVVYLSRKNTLSSRPIHDKYSVNSSSFSRQHTLSNRFSREKYSVESSLLRQNILSLESSLSRQNIILFRIVPLTTKCTLSNRLSHDKILYSFESSLSRQNVLSRIVSLTTKYYPLSNRPSHDKIYSLESSLSRQNTLSNLPSQRKKILFIKKWLHNTKRSNVSGPKVHFNSRWLQTSQNFYSRFQFSIYDIQSFQFMLISIIHFFSLFFIYTVYVLPIWFQ